MPEKLTTFRRNANVGNHVFKHMGAKMRVPPGGEVTCYPSDLGSHIKNYTVISEQEVTEQEVEVQVEKEPSIVTLELKSRGRGYYDIVNPDNPDKPYNDKALRKTAAKKLLAELIGERATMMDMLKELDGPTLLEMMEDKGMEVPESYEDEDELREMIVEFELSQKDEDE